MSRLLNLVTAAALIVTLTSVSQTATAKEHHQARRQHVASEQFRRANAAVVAVPDYPSSMYSGGWSAPAGR